MAWLSSITWITTDTPVLATVLNNIGNDIRTWGGDVDAGGHGLANCASVAGLSGANPLAFKTNGAERMRIDGSGKVGIGVTSPSCRLEVLADSASLRGASLATLRLLRSATSKAASLAFSGAVAADPVIGVNPSSDDLVIAFDNGSAAVERVRFRQSGIVNFSSTPPFANNAAAITGGLVAGDTYVVTGSNPRLRAEVF